MNQSSDDRKELYNSLYKSISQAMAFKMGYPESMMSSLHGSYEEPTFNVDAKLPQKLIDNSVFGIEADSLAELLILNVGNPWTDSSSFSMEIKQLERDVIKIFARLFGIPAEDGRGYVTSGGTEANLAGLWWCSLWLKENLEGKKKAFEEHNRPVVFFTSTHTHYSILKICNLMQLDKELIAHTPEGQMDVKDLERALKAHMSHHPQRGIIMMANVGTTITGAFDDLKTIKHLLDKYTENKKKAKYTIHCDGAMYGITLPIIKPYGPITNYFAELGIDTLTISGHKVLGTTVCGVILTTKVFLNEAFPQNSNLIDYCGDIADITVTGCRPGINILWLHNTLYSLGLDKDLTILHSIVKNNLQHAEYLYGKLVDLLGPENVTWLSHQFNITFKRPSGKLMRKYSLMPYQQSQAAICVELNVGFELIDNFIEDYKKEISGDTKEW